jgi:hypothetical protein
VPVVQIGSYLGPLIFMLGFFLLQMESVAWLGVILFGGTVVFALVTLPVEFDASRRAKAWVASGYAVDRSEVEGVSQMLDAAALTYVAALAQAVSTMLYYVFLLTGSRRRD